MEVFTDFLSKIAHSEHQTRTKEVLHWIRETFPDLEPTIKWNQPMFTDHGTYIIGFSVSKQHLAVAPEQAGMNRFSDEIKQTGFDHTKELIRMKWAHPVDYALLKKMIAFNIQDKSDCQTFWR